MKRALTSILCFSIYQCSMCQEKEVQPPFFLQVLHNGESYEVRFNDITEIINTDEFKNIGLQYFEETNSIKLNGNGYVVINGRDIHVGNEKFSSGSNVYYRMGVEFTLPKTVSDSFNISAFMVSPAGIMPIREILAYNTQSPKYKPIDLDDLPKIETVNISNSTILDIKKYKMINIDGDLVDTHAKILVLNFFILNCARCIEDLKKLEQLAFEFDSPKIQFVALTPDSKETLKANNKLRDIKIPIVPDFGHTIIKEWNIQKFPSSIIVDQHGQVQLISLGKNSQLISKVKLELESLLGE